MKNVFGERITEARLSLGLMQWELAEKMGITEVSMSRYVKGNRIPRADIVVKAANVLNVTTDYLLGVDDIYKEKDVDNACECLEAIQEVLCEVRSLKEELIGLKDDGK